MIAFIIAGGLGTRLGIDTPKVLAPLRNNYTILDYQIDYLRNFNFTKIIVCTGYKHEMIEKHIKDNKLPMEVIIETEQLGTGGWLNLLKEFPNEDFMVMNGDNMFNYNINKLIQAHKRYKPIATIAVRKIKDTSESGLTILSKNKVIQFKEKTGEKKSGTINAGMYIFSPKIKSYLPKETKISIERDIFPKIAKDRQLNAYLIKGLWAAPDTPERLKEAQRKFGVI